MKSEWDLLVFDRECNLISIIKCYNKCVFIELKGLLNIGSFHEKIMVFEFFKQVIFNTHYFICSNTNLIYCVIYVFVTIQQNSILSN